MRSLVKSKGEILSYIFSLSMYLFLIVGLLVVPMVQAFNTGNYFSSYNEGGVSFLGFSDNMLKSLSNAVKPYDAGEKKNYLVFKIQRFIRKIYGFFHNNIVTISIIICWIILVASIILAIVSSVRFLKYGKSTKACNIIALVMYFVYGVLGVMVAIFCGIFLKEYNEIYGLSISTYYFSLSFIVTIIGLILYLMIGHSEKKRIEVLSKKF